MKQIGKRILSLVLVLVTVLSGAVPIYADVSAAVGSMSVKQIEAYQPVFTDVTYLDTAEPYATRTYVEYVVTPKNLPKEISDWMVYAEISSNAAGDGGDSYGYVDSEWKDGKIYIRFNRNDSSVRRSNTHYLRIRYGSRDQIDGYYRYTQYSEAIKLPIVKPWNPTVSGIRISSTQLWVGFSNWIDDWANDSKEWKSVYIRQLQIREVGAKKWSYVSKSNVVQKLKLTKDGYLMTVAKDKEYEFRARYYTVADGKKYYSTYTYLKPKDFNITEQVQNFSALQFDAADENGIILYWDSMETAEYYQLAYRKAGSKAKWKTVKLSLDQLLNYDNGITKKPATMVKVKLGYEYRIRACRTVGGVVSAGKYSAKLTLNKKTVKFVSEPDDALYEYWLGSQNGHTVAERPVYDSNLSVFDNYLVLEEFASGFWAPFIHMSSYYDSKGKKHVGNIIMGDSYDAVAHGYSFGGGIDMCQGEDGIVCVEVYPSVNRRGGGAAIVEILRFFSGDAEMANAFYRWRLAATTFGHANTDYFGFKDVKISDDEWILEYNGNEYRITKGKKGYIFWFDMNE